jgi:hypothetical protein
MEDSGSFSNDEGNGGSERFSGFSLFSVSFFLLTADGPVRHPQLAEIAAGSFMASAHLLNLTRLQIVV